MLQKCRPRRDKRDSYPVICWCLRCNVIYYKMIAWIKTKTGRLTISAACFSRKGQEVSLCRANSQKRRARKTALEFAGYVAPAVFFITLFVGIPFVMCIYYSFRKWNGIGKTSEFIGLENYIRLFTNDPAFVSALKYTFIYAIGTVLIRKCTCHFFCLHFWNPRSKAKDFSEPLFIFPIS